MATTRRSLFIAFCESKSMKALEVELIELIDDKSMKLKAGKDKIE